MVKVRNEGKNEGRGDNMMEELNIDLILNAISFIKILIIY